MQSTTFPPLCEEETRQPTTRKTPSIIEIVETVQALKSAYRPITQEERDLIATWPGWGPYAPAFERFPTEVWKHVGPQLRALLGEDGYESASAATPTSFFTSPYISEAIWKLAGLLGFSGGRVLEPGCGTGQVLSHAPADLDLEITGIEMEPFTADVAQLLFPQATILTSPIQEVALQNDIFDLVVGNVPFADIPIYDRSLPFKERLSLHNYCIYRSLQALRPGGIAILVTSRYTLDAANPRTRQILSDQGILLGAIRLPSHGHKWARTAVITDILVLQKRYPGMDWQGYPWITQKNLSIDGVEITTSTYYVDSPENILGTVSLGRGMYRENELVITAPDDLEDALEKAIHRIVRETESRYIPRVDRTQLIEEEVALRADGLKEGCYYLLDGVLVEIIEGEAKKVTRNAEELTVLVHLRDAALALLEAERDDSKTDDELLPLRLELNRQYDAYVQQYRFLRRCTLIRKVDKNTGEERITRRPPPVMYQFRTDESYPLLLSLEIYDDETGQAQKAAIFTQRVNRPAVYKQTAESREEALALSLDQYGRVHFPFIAKATGIPEADVAAYLGDLVYENPENLEWEIAPLYLSDNVRTKLEVARAALRSDAKWQRNVDALEKVQPEPIPPEDIKVLLGAPWVPVEVIVDFCAHLFHTKPSIAREKQSGAWDVAPPSYAHGSVEATSTWGTRRVSGFRLVEHLLNHKTTTVEDVDSDGKAHVNTEETMLANQKKREIQVRFGEWVWEDNERTKRLSALYNTLYNGVVPTRFDGSHLSFPGMDPFWQENLYNWQRDFIARMTCTRSGLCAYPVGAGKTKIQVAGAMTLRRMNLIRRAAILVPNHLLEQIASEAKQLYPAANILMISRDDLSRENRRIFLSRIATGGHDLVVMTHSAFEAIDVHPETRKAYIEERVRDYKQVLYGMDQDSSDKADQRKIKRIEKLLQRMREQLKELLDTRHDPGITFEQLGISYVIVDEFHFFKNLGLPTNQEKLSVTPSQRAQDMLMKLRWLEKQNGTRPFCSGFTATPISNSMVEAFVMLWYLDHEFLKEREIYTVDDFASLYIESEEQIEVTPNGAGFRMYERPRAFINLPEFLHLFGHVADIRSPDILDAKRPEVLEHTIPVEPTEEVIAFVNDLVARSEDIRNGHPRSIGGKEDNMLWVTTDGRKAALWLGLHGIKEEYPAKLDAIASEMAKVYHRWQEKAAYLPGTYKSLQIGFCDIGTPSKERGEQVYGEIKRLLIQKGVPAQGVRYIHEAGDSDSAKAVLFEKCRNGDVAILLGSTAKLGTGTNIQTRCAAIHHIDAPWRPDEVEQRTGRGQRPGNLYPVVEVFYYVQRRTFDAYSWQILANKAKPFNQIRSGSVTSREIAYSDDSALTYGQVKAAATGDMLLLEHANVSMTVDSFARLHNSFKRARDRDKQEASSLRSRAKQREYTLARYQEIIDQMASYTAAHAFMTPDRHLIDKKEDRRAFVTAAVLKATQKQSMGTLIGYWKGVRITFRVNTLSAKPYTFTIGDPYRGIDLDCNPRWTVEDNRWRFASTVDLFFSNLDAFSQREQEAMAGELRKAEEFEVQSRREFPDSTAWQEALRYKQELDTYIACAASATTPASLAELAQMRERLFAKVASKEQPAAPKKKVVVLPPRNPSATLGEEMSTDTPIDIPIQVEEPETQGPSIEAIARTVQSMVGAKATVTFGDLTLLPGRKTKKKGGGTTRHTIQPGAQSLWGVTENTEPAQVALW